MLSRSFVRYQIYTRYCGEFIIPFFVCGLIVDYGMQGIKRQDNIFIALEAYFRLSRSDFKYLFR